MRIGRLLMALETCASKKLVKIPAAKCPPDAKVTVWGNSFLTQTILLDLKISPLLKEIRIYDTKSNAKRLAEDLNQIQTNSIVCPYYGGYQLGAALKDVDVIVLTGGYYGVPGESHHSIFLKNLPCLLDVAYECAHHNPTAAVVVVTPPGTRNVPMISELYEKIGIEDPGKIMSPMYQHEMLLSKLVADTFGLPNSVVSLPVVGGCCPGSVIPVFSHATPQNEFSELEIEDILKSLRHSHEKISVKQKGRPVSLSLGMATSKLILDVLKGSFGMSQTPQSVFMRSDVLITLKYLGTPVEFGAGGVKKNAYMPQLSDLEMQMLSEVVLFLQKDAEIGKAAALSKWNEIEM